MNGKLVNNKCRDVMAFEVYNRQ